MKTSIRYIFDPPKVQQDKCFQEFLRGKIHCQNFINQDFTFLQPSVLHVTQPNEDSILPEAITTEVPLIAPQESDSDQEWNANSSPVSSVEALYDRNRGNNRTAPIQLVEAVVGLTSKEQSRREEDPDLTLDELLGLISCEQHITTPLQTLDILYVHQPSQFLPLAQEAMKLAKKLKDKDEPSQWSGIPIKKLLNDSFTEQLNYIQALKYLELYGQRQLQLFTVLEKYHQVPDGLEDLKSQFSFLKEATSRNVENLQQAITVQQTCTTNLCGHVNVILSRLTKLENNIQKLMEKFTAE